MVGTPRNRYHEDDLSVSRIRLTSTHRILGCVVHGSGLSVLHAENDPGSVEPARVGIIRRVSQPDSRRIDDRICGTSGTPRRFRSPPGNGKAGGKRRCQSNRVVPRFRPPRGANEDRESGVFECRRRRRETGFWPRRPGQGEYDAELLRKIDLAKIESEGYSFQIEMTRAAINQGARIIEVPITFVERIIGQSKMSPRIVREAMTRVTSWGFQREKNFNLGIIGLFLFSTYQ